MNLKTPQIVAFVALITLCATLSHAQRTPMPERVANRSHPIAIKTDLWSFRSQAFTLEGEVLLFWRVSAFAQAGIIQGMRHDSQWRSHGYIGRAGLKLFLGSKEATKMTGLALRCEVATRSWEAVGGKNTHDQKDVACFAGLSYTWNPFDRLVVEPSLGLGMAWWRESFSDPNILGIPSGIPRTPWFQRRYNSGEPVYDANGDLIALEGIAGLKVNVGLSIGIRL